MAASSLSLRRRFLTCVAAAGAVSVALSAQQPAQSPFRASVDLVAVFATVVNADGGFQGGLTKDDFTLLDNGKVQEITSFSSEAQAISVSVVLDTSSSMADAQRRSLRAATMFVDNLRDGDRAMIGTLWFQGPPFTDDKARLHGSLSLLPKDRSSPVFAALDRAVTSLQPETNRRVILIYTDGKNNTYTGMTHWVNGRQVPIDPAQLEENVRARIETESVMVYAFSFEGAPLTKDMKTIAKRSGGRATDLKTSDDLATALAAVADELHHQYLLGFTPAVFDGKVHTLEVRAKPKNLTVRARQSYVAQVR